VLHHDLARFVVAPARLDRHDDTALAELLVVVAGLVLRHSCAGQCTDDAARGRTECRAAERCRDRACCDDRANAGNRKRADPDEPAGDAAQQTAGKCAGGCPGRRLSARVFGQATGGVSVTRQDADVVGKESGVTEGVDGVLRVVSLVKDGDNCIATLHGRSSQICRGVVAKEHPSSDCSAGREARTGPTGHRLNARFQTITRL
jgi:hypothetical protein